MLIVVVDESVFVMVPSAARLPVLMKVVCTAAARTTMLLRSIASPVGSVPVWWMVLLALWVDCLVPVVIDVPKASESFVIGPWLATGESSSCFEWSKTQRSAGFLRRR